MSTSQTPSDAIETVAPGPSPPPVPAELATATSRFERGDFRGAAEEIERLLANHPPPPVGMAARDLLARMAPDRRGLYVGLSALAILVLVAALYIRR